jgi:hypothetical protein
VVKIDRELASPIVWDHAPSGVSAEAREWLTAEARLDTAYHYIGRGGRRAVVSAALLSETREALSLSRRELGRRIADRLDISANTAYQRVRRAECGDVKSLTLPTLDAIRDEFNAVIVALALDPRRSFVA